MVYVLTHSPCNFLTYFSLLEAHNDGMHTVAQLKTIPELSWGKDRHLLLALHEPFLII